LFITEEPAMSATMSTDDTASTRNPRDQARVLIVQHPNLIDVATLFCNVVARAAQRPNLIDPVQLVADVLHQLNK
jgi:hypothetical protein